MRKSKEFLFQIENQNDDQRGHISFQISKTEPKLATNKKKSESHTNIDTPIIAHHGPPLLTP